MTSRSLRKIWPAIQCHRETCLKTILKNIKEETAPAILKLMDETKDYFRTSIYKEMVLVLDRINCGIAVDEIAGIEDLMSLDGTGRITCAASVLTYVMFYKAPNIKDLYLSWTLTILPGRWVRYKPPLQVKTRTDALHPIPAMGAGRALTGAPCSLFHPS